MRRFIEGLRRAIYPRLDLRQERRASSVILAMTAVLAAVICGAMLISNLASGG